MFIYGEAQKKAKRAVRIYQERYPGLRVSDYKLEGILLENQVVYSVHIEKSNKPVRDDNAIALALQHFKNTLKNSFR